MTVHISEGLYLSDDNARRFARHMRADLAKHNAKANAFAERLIANGVALASLGNPIGQKRTFDRFIKALGPTCLKRHLTPGKRGRFRFEFSMFDADEVDGLYLVSVFVRSRGNGAEVEHTDSPVMRFSGHAMQRLIQRAGVRSGDDYIPILRSLAVPARVLFGATLAKGIPDGQTWPLPVRVNGERILLLVKTEPGNPLPVAATVYEGAWRQGPEIDRLEEMLGTFDLYNPKWDGIEPFRAAFIAASRYFH